jgi:hypothetical protein
VEDESRVPGEPLNGYIQRSSVAPDETLKTCASAAAAIAAAVNIAMRVKRVVMGTPVAWARSAENARLARFFAILQEPGLPDRTPLAMIIATESQPRQVAKDDFLINNTTKGQGCRQ